MRRMAEAEHTSEQKVNNPVTEIQKKIRADIEDAGSNTNKKEALVSAVRKDLEDAEMRAWLVRQEEERGILIQRENEVKFVARSVVRTLEAVKAEMLTVPPSSKVVLSKLAARAEKLPESTFSHLYQIVKTYLIEDISFSPKGQQKTVFEKDFAKLQEENPYAAEILRQCVVESAQDLGETEEHILEQMAIEKRIEDDVDVRTKKKRFRDAIGEIYNKYLQTSSGFQSLSFKERQDFFEELDAISKPQNEQSIIQSLQGFGLKSEMIKQLIELAKKSELLSSMQTQGERKEVLESFGLNPEEQSYFSSITGLNRFKKDDGDLSDEGKRRLKKAALKAINNLISIADHDPDREFEKSYSDFYEGGRYRDFLKAIRGLADEARTRWGPGGDRVADFIIRGVLQEVTRERELRELYHNVGIWIKISTPKELIGLVSRYDVSLLSAPLTSESGGKIIAMAISEFERYLQFDMAMNKNTPRPSLLSSAQNSNLLLFESKDREMLKRRIQSRIDEMKKHIKNKGDKDASQRDHIQKYDTQNYEEVEEWEVERAIKYARGVSFLTTMRAFSIIASGNVQEKFFGAANNFYNMAAFFNPAWKWRMGRGSLAFTLHAPELYNIEVDTRPQLSFWRRIFKGSEWKFWHPKEFEEKSKSYYEEIGLETDDETERNFLLQSLPFKKMLQIFGIGDLPTRAGWRMEGIKTDYIRFKDLIDKALGKEMKNNWEKSYEALAQVIGVGSRFFYDADRARDFAQKQLFSHLRAKGELHVDEDKMSSASKEKFTHDYASGKKYSEIIYRDPITGKGFTYFELMEVKTLMWRGDNFYALLKRSPIDFLTNLTQIFPEILPEKLDGITVKGKQPDGSEKKFDIFEIIGIEDENQFRQELNNFGPDDQKKLREHRKRMIERFGKKNIEPLQKFHHFYKKLTELGEGKFKDIKDEKLLKEEITEWFYNELALATEKVKIRNGLEIEEQDIEDPEIKKLLFNKEKGGDEGIITYFTEKTDEESAFGDDSDILGQENNFFYRVGRTWYQDMGHSLHPNTADMDWRFVFNKLGQEAGEDTIKRLWGDLHGWNEVTNKLQNLDHLLHDVAKTGKFEEIYKLHHEIHSLEGIGLDMHKANYYLAATIARYFKEDSAARLPFLVGDLYGFIHGKDVSLSKIHGGRFAKSKNSDDLNAYFRTLMYNGDIAKVGPWSFEMLSRSLRVDTEKVVCTEILPKVFIFVGFYLLWKFFNQSRKEQLEGGRR